MSAGQPRLLDLFCGAGGCTKGYQRAGFWVYGVDHIIQPDYCGDGFEKMDVAAVSDLLAFGFDAIHASPPCQFGTPYNRRPNHVKDSPNLIPHVRSLLAATGLPYVIENTWANRAHLIDPVRYCGSSFGLDVQRHRAFEANWPLVGLPCDHSIWTARFPQATNRANPRKTVEVGVWRIPLHVQQRAMGIDWMTRPELSQAIPPAYTEHIGRQLMAVVQARQEAA